MRNVIFSALTLLVCSVSITAQVTIGSYQPPRTGAGLDLNSNNKGLLLPNVSLSNPETAFQLDGGDPATAAGMVVYNTGNSLDGPGVYVWSGSRWILITCEPETPGTITLSPTTVNLNGTFTASVPEVTGPAAPTSYLWSYPDGLTVTGSATSRSITFTSNAFRTYDAGTITVQAENACGTSNPQISPLAITIRDCTGAPAAPTLSITATTINRTGTTTLSCTDVGNGATTYEWTLPAGLTGSSTTNSITVAGATAGTYQANTISVKATNACGNTTATGSGGAITVRDCSGAPATPTLTVTATSINKTGTTTLSCTDVGNGATAYEWTLPSGLTGSSSTRSITVTGTTTGTYQANTISVKATNACGSSTTATGSGGAITVRDCTGAPATPTLSVTATSIYQNATFTLTCTSVSGATGYSWTLPSGLTGSSTTNTITVTGKTAGTYAASTIKVTATNACGNSTTATGSGGAITVVAKPTCSGTISGDLCWATTDAASSVKYTAAVAACSSYSENGDSWRMPTPLELAAICNDGVTLTMNTGYWLLPPGETISSRWMVRPGCSTANDAVGLHSVRCVKSL
jgi:hypothetical protein